ncbi:MAG: prolipoprotein diacylglyceryl transferase [Nitrospinae bacterium]|nr:prolipoprotein diacylglyceryl transferase [Nitrospinota bacterium]MBF0633690.1 prolipoprotein diacylglyceryl transferase [Nitrospinota bacterium]
MHPILFQFGPITLHTYGLLAASGFLLGIAWTARLARREGVIDQQVVYDASFWLIISALVSSRLAYVIVEYRHYISNPLGVFKIWEGGLVFYGGVIGAVGALILLARIYKFDVWRFADLAAPGGALGHAVGRLGCFFAGCCYGQPTDVPWAVTFNDIHSIAPIGIPLHPTQLYDALNELVVFSAITILWPRRKFVGQIWWTWVGLYAVGRAIVETFRGDPRGALLDGVLSTSQTAAVVAVALALFFYFKNRKAFTGDDNDGKKRNTKSSA